MIKLITIAGTRPELIRLSILLSKLDQLLDSKLLYTNQNFTKNLSEIFFEELKIRRPDYLFEPQNSIGNFLANAFIEFEKILKIEEPDKILILGDTNSGLLAIIANKYNIPIIHMEAGNRCFNNKVPEEANRRVIDLLSTYNLPYTENSKQNLLSEGFHKNYVFKTGNPIYEVLNYYELVIETSNVLSTLGLNYKDYVLVTIHRSENVDNEEPLYNLVKAINIIAAKYKVVVSLHPRTKSKMDLYGFSFHKNIIVSKPFGFFDFVKLEKNAKIVISDSGTVIEETCLFKVPSITIRNSTERHEIVECGATVLVGIKPDVIVGAFNSIVDSPCNWTSPSDYLVENVSDIVINILLGK